MRTRPAEAAPGRLEPRVLPGTSLEHLVPNFTIDVGVQRGLLALRLGGEIDAQAMPRLRATLASVSRLTPPVMSLDFTHSTFVGLSAMGALLVARTRARTAQVRVITPGAPSQFYRLMDATDRVNLFGLSSGLHGRAP